MIKIEVEKTKKGFPAYWETGGGCRNTGTATIIADQYGQPKKAAYIRRRGELANSAHALIILEVGDYIIIANHHRRDFYVEISRITGFENDGEETFAVVEQINRFDKNEWDTEFPMFLKAAVEAAVAKATCYHCREPHFTTIE